MKKIRKTLRPGLKGTAFYTGPPMPVGTIMEFDRKTKKWVIVGNIEDETPLEDKPYG